MINLTVRMLFAAIAMAAVIPIGSVAACPGPQLHAEIAFESSPRKIPSGLGANYFHLSNQVPEFRQWSKLRSIAIRQARVEMRHFSFIGMGALIDPSTWWLSSILPRWLAPKRKYVAIFAPVSSCTENFFPFERKVDSKILLVGTFLTLASGEQIFAAASYRRWDDRWETHASRYGQH